MPSSASSEIIARFDMVSFLIGRCPLMLTHKTAFKSRLCSVDKDRRTNALPCQNLQERVAAGVSGRGCPRSSLRR